MDWWRNVDEPFKIKYTLGSCRDESFRAILLHSPGWNEGKARYETLGTYKTKNYMSSFRSGTFSAHVWFVSLWGYGRLCCGRRSAAPKGAQKNGYQCLTQGLRPGLWKSIAPLGLFVDNTTTTSARIHENKYEVFTSVSTRKHFGKYAHSLSWVRRTYFSTLFKVDCVRIKQVLSTYQTIKIQAIKHSRR